MSEMRQQMSVYKHLLYRRSTLYYRERGPNGDDLEMMRRLDEQYTETPFYRYRRLTIYLRGVGSAVNHKRVLRLGEI